MYGNNHLAGFDYIKEWLLRLKREECAYRVCRLPLQHLLLEVESGNGQSYLTEHIVQFLKEHDLRSFDSMDDYLEYHLDGSLKQMDHVFQDIGINAVYTLYFEGVIAMDVSALGLSVNEEPMKVFVKEMKDVMKHATVILFLSPNCSNKQVLKKMLTDKLGVKEIPVDSYSEKEYAHMIVLRLRELGVKLRNPERQKVLFTKLVHETKVRNVKEAVCLAEKLAVCADYSGGAPVLSVEGTKELFLSVNEQMAV